MENMPIIASDNGEFNPIKNNTITLPFNTFFFGLSEPCLRFSCTDLFSKRISSSHPLYEEVKLREITFKKGNEVSFIGKGDRFNSIYTGEVIYVEIKTEFPYVTNILHRSSSTLSLTDTSKKPLFSISSNNLLPLLKCSVTYLNKEPCRNFISPLDLIKKSSLYDQMVERCLKIENDILEKGIIKLY